MGAGEDRVSVALRRTLWVLFGWEGSGGQGRAGEPRWTCLGTRTEVKPPRSCGETQAGTGGREAHPGHKVLLQLLHQKVGWLLLVGLVGLQVAPGLLWAEITGHI